MSVSDAAARWSVNDVSPKGKLLTAHVKATAPFYAFEMLKLYRRRGEVFSILGIKSTPLQIQNWIRNPALVLLIFE